MIALEHVLYGTLFKTYDSLLDVKILKLSWPLGFSGLHLRIAVELQHSIVPKFLWLPLITNGASHREMMTAVYSQISMAVGHNSADVLKYSWLKCSVDIRAS